MLIFIYDLQKKNLILHGNDQIFYFILFLRISTKAMKLHKLQSAIEYFLGERRVCIFVWCCMTKGNVCICGTHSWSWLSSMKDGNCTSIASLFQIVLIRNVIIHNVCLRCIVIKTEIVYRCKDGLWCQECLFLVHLISGLCRHWC